MISGSTEEFFSGYEINAGIKRSINNAIRNFVVKENQKEAFAKVCLIQKPKSLKFVSSSTVKLAELPPDHKLLGKVKLEFTLRNKDNPEEGYTMSLNPENHNQIIIYRDPRLPMIEGNMIESQIGAPIIACRGPQTTEELENFFHSLLLNPQLSASVNQIICFGNNFAGTKGEFIPYFIPEVLQGLKITHNNTTYTCTIKNEDEKQSIKKEFCYRDNFPQEVVNAKITLTPSCDTLLPITVSIHAIIMRDCTTLDLKNDPNDKIKKIFLDAARASNAGQLIAVHCKGGVGRTGHGLLMLEMLKDQAHFSDSTLTSLEKEALILAKVATIRKNRPVLIWIKEQYEAAVENFEILQKYRQALEKKSTVVSESTYVFLKERGVATYSESSVDELMKLPVKEVAQKEVGLDTSKESVEAGLEELLKRPKIGT